MVVVHTGFTGRLWRTFGFVAFVGGGIFIGRLHLVASRRVNLIVRRFKQPYDICPTKKSETLWKLVFLNSEKAWVQGWIAFRGAMSVGMAAKVPKKLAQLQFTWCDHCVAHRISSEWRSARLRIWAAFVRHKRVPSRIINTGQ